MELFNKAIRAIQFTGLINTVRTILYALNRTWLEYRYGTQITSKSNSISPGKWLRASVESQGLRACFENADVNIRFLAEDLVRVTWEPGTAPIPYAIARTNWPPVEVEITERAGQWRLQSSNLNVTLDRSGRLIYRNQADQVLREELPPVHKGNAWTHRSTLQENEHFFGLGERAAPFNLAGESCRLWNTDPGGGYVPGDDPLYLSIPVFLGLHVGGAYLIFYENSHDGYLIFGDHTEASFKDGALRYYFIPGPPERALERYMDLTGQPPLPPRWAFGFHQSRWGYKNANDVRQVIAGFQAHQLPLTAVHLDIDYMDGYRIFTVDPQRFPDLSALAEELRRQDIRLVAILDPGIKKDPGYSMYTEGLEGGHFCTAPDGEPQPGLVWPGWSVFPDFTRIRTRDWWGSRYPELIDRGISGIWHDMNEPAAFAAWGELTLPLSTQHSLEGRGGDHREAHNLYGLLMNRAGYEALQRTYPKIRPWILTRSGWAGIARYAWHWTGDIESSWECLKQTIPTLLGLGLSGVPFSGSDIGGFLGDPEPELFLRWFQLAAFTPFFRSHSALTASRREPWTFEQTTLNSIRAALQLRESLLPYLYTLAWRTHKRGLPMMRPLFWDYPEDEKFWDVGDCFLLGEELLVAPVIEAGVKARQVRFPPGTWYALQADEIYQGPGERSCPVCLEHIPCFVRGGSILPMESQDKLSLHIYPTADRFAEGSLYLDAGEGPVEQEADWRLDKWRLSPTQEGGMIAWNTEGDFPFPYQNIEIELHGGELFQVYVDGENFPCDQNRFQTSVFKQVKLYLK